MTHAPADLTMRRLTDADRPALQALLEADPGYTERVDGAPPAADAAEQLLTGRPAGVSDDDKVVLGAFADGALVAVVDLLRGWPAPDTVHVGLLQVHAGAQRRGTGASTHRLMLEEVRGWPGVSTLRAAIVATNATHADPFWAAMGYAPSGDPQPYQAGATATTVRIWTRRVHDSPEVIRPS